MLWSLWWSGGIKWQVQQHNAVSTLPQIQQLFHYERRKFGFIQLNRTFRQHTALTDTLMLSQCMSSLMKESGFHAEDQTYDVLFKTVNNLNLPQCFSCLTSSHEDSLTVLPRKHRIKVP